MCRSTSTRTLTFIIAPTWCGTRPFAAVKGRYQPPAAHKERLSFECRKENHAGAHVLHGIDDDRNGDACAQADDAAVVGHHRPAARIGTTTALSAAR